MTKISCPFCDAEFNNAMESEMHECPPGTDMEDDNIKDVTPMGNVLDVIDKELNREKETSECENTHASWREEIKKSELECYYIETKAGDVWGRIEARMCVKGPLVVFDVIVGGNEEQLIIPIDNISFIAICALEEEDE